MFICPTAVATLPRIYYIYNNNTGNVSGHYFFSDLMTRMYNNGWRTRINTVGPYRINEIARPSNTYMSGDATAFYTGTTYPNYDLAMNHGFSHGNIGERSSFFGVVTTFSNHGFVVGGPNPPSIHPGSANGLFFDGHAATIPMPGTTSAAMAPIRRQFTANYSGNQESY